MFPPNELVDSEFHQYLFTAVKNEQNIEVRRRMACVLGNKVVARLIKQKKYRKDLTEFVDNLRTSKCFRDRQMYLVIAQAAFDLDPEIYKKHFAKAIGNEMTEEKVHVVKILLAKLTSNVPKGYSKSTDKIAEVLQA